MDEKRSWMKLSDVASNALMSERTVQRYVERCSEKTIGPVGCLTATVRFWTRTAAAGSESCLAEASTDVARQS